MTAAVPTAPMAEEDAYQWLMSGQWLPAGGKPAGRLSQLRAQRLMESARAEGTIHLTRGRDLYAPGWLLAYSMGEYRAMPTPPRPTTPWQVARSMEAAGYEMAAVGRRGWVTHWGGDDIVRVEQHGCSLNELKGVKRYLERSGWLAEIETTVSAAWLSVTQQAEKTGEQG